MNYNSPEGMDSRIWGPNLWNYLHTVSFNYPVNPSEEDKDNYMRFLLNLKYTLPCRECRSNYFKNLRKSGFSRKVMKNRDVFSRFIFKFHNVVNKKLGKRIHKSFTKVRDFYNSSRVVV